MTTSGTNRKTIETGKQKLVEKTNVWIFQVTNWRLCSRNDQEITKKKIP